jgi:hypothetical protein
LGTSTPTSITVVATSTWISLACEGVHHRRLLGGFEPAVHQADLQDPAVRAQRAKFGRLELQNGVFGSRPLLQFASSR